ncbi:TetR/AcrR family transcriptional regulator [Pseudobacteriovorax antillogorgiicola]|uniref:Transcriptional regulator, TetR family n=1 Tax=Pseudobacteriovorax antillogorgiicola TaxID=1513793 RepID=A0A1Y6CQJ8_9BACT|nr:TetR/AcrR family transcriptional regulator [Pseudobacteriovorax antillogorgiicola]TCS46367.1 TetR family transcriptional regulator [Pseudobacteriovorax antillogorgiicola]SMF68497.1 transcriptional regulator, TetR family [Pseudobacteriovorax antillogorgiicola]
MVNDMTKERNKEKTKQALITTTLEILAEDGFANLGVNEIARRSGVNKALIYRYFKSYKGLLEAVAKSGDLFPSSHEILDGIDLNESSAAIASQIFRNYITGIRNRPIAQKIMAWELNQNNKITEILADAREAVSQDIFHFLAPKLPELKEPEKIHYTTAIVGSGLLHLCLRSISASHWDGVHLRDEKEWQRLFAAVEQIFQIL